MDLQKIIQDRNDYSKKIFWFLTMVSFVLYSIGYSSVQDNFPFMVMITILFVCAFFSCFYGYFTTKIQGNFQFEDEIRRLDSHDFIELANRYIIKKYDETTDSLLLFNTARKAYICIPILKIVNYKKVSAIEESNEFLDMIKE